MNGEELKTLLASAKHHEEVKDFDAAIKSYFQILTGMLSPNASVDLEARIQAIMLSQAKLFQLIHDAKKTNDTDTDTAGVEYYKEISELSNTLREMAKDNDENNQLVYAIFYEMTKQYLPPFYIYLPDPSPNKQHVTWLSEFQQVFNFKDVLIWALETKQITQKQLEKAQNSLAGELLLDVGGKPNFIFQLFLTHYQAWLAKNHPQQSTQALDQSTKIFFATVIKAAVAGARASNYAGDYLQISKDFKKPAPKELVESVQSIINHYIKSRESGASRLFRNSALTSEKLEAAKRLSSILEARAGKLTLRQLHKLLQNYKSLNASIETDSGKTYSVFTNSGFDKALTRAETIVNNTAKQPAESNPARPR